MENDFEQRLLRLEKAIFNPRGGLVPEALLNLGKAAKMPMSAQEIMAGPWQVESDGVVRRPLLQGEIQPAIIVGFNRMKPDHGWGVHIHFYQLHVTFRLVLSPTADNIELGKKIADAFLSYLGVQIIENVQEWNELKGRFA